jgi:hypothetical protein
MPLHCRLDVIQKARLLESKTIDSFDPKCYGQQAEILRIKARIRKEISCCQTYEQLILSTPI